jgi:hypothetical protein
MAPILITVLFVAAFSAGAATTVVFYRARYRGALTTSRAVQAAREQGRLEGRQERASLTPPTDPRTRG